MTKSEKLLQRFLRRPKDLTWEEYVKVFEMFGFELHKNTGSKRSFVNANNDIFYIHEPHPKNVMKAYTIKQAIQWLTEKGHLSDHQGES